jgi:nitrite reductase/ring-hydroxylating ferredoxin subunit
VIATSAAVAELGQVEPPPRRPTLKQALARARPGTVTAARDGVRPVALVVLHDRRAYAVDDACPHDGGSLSDGFLDGDRLVCARHGWEVDPCSGACRGDRLDARFVGSVR